MIMKSLSHCALAAALLNGFSAHAVNCPPPSELEVNVPDQVTTEEGGSVEVTFRLNEEPSRDVTVVITTSDASEGFPDVTKVVLTPETYDQPHSVFIRGIDDAENDGAVPYSITLSEERLDPTQCPAFNPVTIAFTNLDNDHRPPPTVSTLTILTNLPPEIGDLSLWSVSPDGSVLAGTTRLKEAEWRDRVYQNLDVLWTWSEAEGLSLSGPIELDGGLYRAEANGFHLSRDGAEVVTSCRWVAGSAPQRNYVQWSRLAAEPMITHRPHAGRDYSEGSASPSGMWRAGSWANISNNLILGYHGFVAQAVGDSLDITRLSRWDSLRDIADDGTAVGEIRYEEDTRRDSGIWRPGQSEDKLLPIDPDQTHSHSYARLVSDDGKVVAGDRGFEDLSGYAYRWTEAGGMQPLDARGVTSISADGNVLVGRMWVWTEWDGLRDLFELLETEHGIPTTTPTYDISGSYDVWVSGDGHTIVGYTSFLHPDTGLRPWTPWVAHLADHRRDRITVSAIAGQPTETGGQATFSVALDAPPEFPVQIPLSVSDAEEVLVHPNPLIIPAGEAGPVTVTVTGRDDFLVDGAQPVAVHLLKSSSADTRFTGIDAPDVFLTNLDNESPLDLGWEPPRYIPLNGNLPQGFYLSSTLVAGEFSYSTPPDSTLNEPGVHQVTMTFTPDDPDWMPIETTTEIEVLPPLEEAMPAPVVQLPPDRASLSLQFTAPTPGILIIDKSSDLGNWSRVHEELVEGQSTFTDDRINQASQGYYRCQWLSVPE